MISSTSYCILFSFLSYQAFDRSKTINSLSNSLGFLSSSNQKKESGIEEKSTIMSNNTTYFPLQSNLNSSNFDGDEKTHNVVWFVVCFSSLIVIAILSPVAVVGNALVLAAIWRNPSLRTPYFNTGLISHPFCVANEFMYLVEAQINTTRSDNRSTLIIIQAIANGCATFF